MNENEEGYHVLTPDDYADIDSTIALLSTALEHNHVKMGHASAALMMMAAACAVRSIETDEVILEEFHKCLIHERTQGALPN